MALSSSATPSPTAPATAPPASEPGQETAAEPAVLTRELGVTAYRKRLERAQQQEPVPAAVHAARGDLEGRAVVARPSRPAPTASRHPEADRPRRPRRPNHVHVEHLARCQHAAVRPPPSLRATPRSRPLDVFLRRIDVTVGPPGDLAAKDRRRAGQDAARARPKPMVVFAGATREHEARAFFLVSDDVSAVSGDGPAWPRRPPASSSPSRWATWRSSTTHPRRPHLQAQAAGDQDLVRQADARQARERGSTPFAKPPGDPGRGAAEGRSRR